MSGRALRDFAAAGVMAAATQMAFSFMEERGIARPAVKLTEARKAEAHRMIRRSKLRGNARMFAHAIVREANEDGVAVLSHGDLAEVAGCSTRTSKRRVPDRIEGAWATVIRPPIYACNRRPGQPQQTVFVWNPHPEQNELRDAKPPRERRSSAARADRFVSDPEGPLPTATPATALSTPPEPTAEDREFVALALAELDRLRPSPVWSSPAYVEELFRIARDANRHAGHIAGAAEGMAKLIRKGRRDGKEIKARWATETLKDWVPQQHLNKVAKRVLVVRSAAAAPAPPPPPVVFQAGVSRETLGRAHVGIALSTGPGALGALAAIARPAVPLLPGGTVAAAPAALPEPEKPPD